MEKIYSNGTEDFEWDETIVPKMNHKKIFVLGSIPMGLLLLFIAFNTKSIYLNGPFGWWPVLPSLGIFICMAIAFKRMKCRSCDSRIRLLTLEYSENLRVGVMLSAVAEKYFEAKWSDYYVHLYVCDTCRRRAIVGMSHINAGE